MLEVIRDAYELAFPADVHQDAALVTGDLVKPEEVPHADGAHLHDCNCRLKAVALKARLDVSPDD